MSLFKAMMHLNELQINGQTVDDNDDFNVGEDEDTTPTNSEAQNDNPSDTAQTDAEANNDTAEQSIDDNEDDFTLDDADEGDTTETQSTDGEPSDDNTGDENTSNDTSQNDDTNTDNTAGEESENDSDDDFTVDGNDEGGDSGEDNSQNDTSNSGGPNSNDTPEDPSDSIQDDEDRAAEEAIYDSLTDDQKRIRVLQLKLNYKDLYETMNTTLDGIDNIPKNTDNIETIKRLTMLLTKAKSILIDYVENNFDSNPYLENYTMYIKYMAVFRTAAKVIEELNAASEK